jgi:hypothetical protein
MERNSIEYNHALRICTCIRPTQQGIKQTHQAVYGQIQPAVIGQTHQIIIEGLDRARSRTTPFETEEQHSKVFKSQAANPNGKPHTRRVQGFAKDVAMEDRRAEAIRRVH